jgi:argininosuccinate lyase
METYRSFSDLFEEDLYEEISLDTCVKKRISKGSTGPGSVDYQLSLVAEYLGIK